MALKDGEMHLISSFVTAAIAAAVFVPTVYFTRRAEAQGPDFSKMEAIEASIAQLKTTNSRQPQKHFRQPEVVKQQGVSHDKPTKPDKKDQPPKPEDIDKTLAKFHHGDDQDPVGPVTAPAVGDLHGSVNSDAAFSKGDPFLGRLTADMAYHPPKIAQCSGEPVGCIMMQPDGKIRDVLFKVHTNDDCEVTAAAALKRLKKLRDEKPEEVPTRLLDQIANKYLCFKFTVAQ
jgi:hypothetical protein